MWGRRRRETTGDGGRGAGGKETTITDRSCEGGSNTGGTRRQQHARHDAAPGKAAFIATEAIVPTAETTAKKRIL